VSVVKGFDDVFENLDPVQDIRNCEQLFVATLVSDPLDWEQGVGGNVEKAQRRVRVSEAKDLAELTQGRVAQVDCQLPVTSDREALSAVVVVTGKLAMEGPRQFIGWTKVRSAQPNYFLGWNVENAQGASV